MPCIAERWKKKSTPAISGFALGMTCNVISAECGKTSLYYPLFYIRVKSVRHGIREKASCRLSQFILHLCYGEQIIALWPEGFEWLASYDQSNEMSVCLWMQELCNIWQWEVGGSRTSPHFLYDLFHGLQCHAEPRNLKLAMGISST